MKPLFYVRRCPVCDESYGAADGRDFLCRCQRRGRLIGGIVAVIAIIALLFFAIRSPAQETPDHTRLDRQRAIVGRWNEQQVLDRYAGQIKREADWRTYVLCQGKTE